MRVLAFVALLALPCWSALALPGPPKSSELKLETGHVQEARGGSRARGGRPYARTRSYRASRSVRVSRRATASPRLSVTVRRVTRTPRAATIRPRPMRTRVAPAPRVLGFLLAAEARRYIPWAPPAPTACWYYTSPDRRIGWWAPCPAPVLRPL